MRGWVPGRQYSLLLCFPVDLTSISFSYPTEPFKNFKAMLGPSTMLVRTLLTFILMTPVSHQFWD